MYQSKTLHLFGLLLFIIFLVVAIRLPAAKPSGNVKKGLSQITPAFMKKNIDFLASDSMKGRNTPSSGLNIAAGYIAGSFREFGLMTVNGSFYQPFTMCTRNLGAENHLEIIAKGNRSDYQIKSDYIPCENTGDRAVEGTLVFAGYGITAPEYQYDDYAGTDVRGKIVLVFRHEPGENDSMAKVFKGKEPTSYSNLFEKVKNARDHGAIGVMVVAEPLNYKSIRPRGYPWPSLSKNLPLDALPMGYCDEIGDTIPVVQVGEEVIKGIFGSLDSLRALQHQIDSTFAPGSFSLGGISVKLKTTIEKTEKYTVDNVVGLLPGSDPALNEEIVVIGAHYDHVGVAVQHKANEDSIFNGADDNASGTTGVLAVAKAMTAMKKKPGRSVLFILFAGEEKGLFGSGYYVKHPLFPLDKTVAMLNMDMISRNSPDSLEIIGALRCPDLETVINNQNHKTGFILQPKKMSGGSDHWNFYKNNIPSVFFFTGFHKDYHRESDNPDKSDPKKASRVAKLVFLTTWYIANDPMHYKLLEGEDDEFGF
jgi:hypothetical protein